MLRRNFVVLSIAVMMNSTSAVKPVRAQQFTIEGTVDCGTWIEARTVQQASYLEHYLLGLLNGMVLGSRIEFWRAGGVKVSREQVFLWMDKYCESTPLSTPIEGAMMLIQERTGYAWNRR